MKMTSERLADQYKTIIFELINLLRLTHHKPDDKIIEQNEHVLDK